MVNRGDKCMKCGGKMKYISPNKTLVGRVDCLNCGNWYFDW